MTIASTPTFILTVDADGARTRFENFDAFSNGHDAYEALKASDFVGYASLTILIGGDHVDSIYFINDNTNGTPLPDKNEVIQSVNTDYASN